MADTIEKIYCTDGRDNDLAAILAATKNNDPATMMAAMGRWHEQLDEQSFCLPSLDDVC
jgi:hypothetical protein